MKHTLRIVYKEKNPAQVNGKPSTRTILEVNPEKLCRFAVEKGPCKHCTFWKGKSNKGVLFEEAIKDIEEGRIELLIGGSLLDERQVPTEVLRNMLRLLAQTQAEVVLVESRPEYITREKLRLTREALGGKVLEVAIGLETTDEAFRHFLLKGFSKWEFYDATSRIAENGAFPVVYLLTGTDMRKEDAISDLMTSAYELSTLQEKLGVPIRIAIESFFPGGTALAPGKYLTPTFIARIVRDIVREMGIQVFIATSSEGLCEHPLASAKVHLDLFNATQDVRHLCDIIDKKVRV